MSRYKFKLTPYHLFMSLLALFGASALWSTWIAYDPGQSWPVGLALFVSLVLFGLIASAVVSPRLVGRALVIAAWLVAVYFITQYAHFNYQEEVGPLAALGRYTGSIAPDLVFFTPHPNAVATFLEGAFLVNLALVRWAGDRRWMWAVGAVVMAYALLISGSRGAWLGIAAALGIWLYLQSSKERARQLSVLGLGLLIGIGGGTVAAGLLTAPDDKVLVLSSTFEAARSRLSLYQNSLHLLRDYAFTGVGLGDTFAMVYSRYQLLIHVPYLYYAHNIFLSISLGQGLLGLLTFIGLLILFYYFVVRVEQVGLPTKPLLLFRAAWLGVAASLIHGLLDSVQFSGAVWTMPMLFVLAGMTVALGRPALEVADQGLFKRTQPRRNVSQKTWVWLLVIIILSVGVAAFFWRPLTAAWYANWGSVYQTRAELSPYLDRPTRRADLNRATTYFDRTLKLDPTHPVAHRRLGMIALDQHKFEAAAAHLETAYQEEPRNEGTIKALGLAYLWMGQLDAAETLLRQVELKPQLMDGLTYWQWRWGRQNRPELAHYAAEMLQRLAE